jgi:preprotein translocase subunit SecD
VAPPTNAPKPWRTIGLFVLVLVILGGITVWQTQGDPKPKLALDLSSGTTVTLTAEVPGGGKPSTSSMNEAVNIIRDRVNGSGVSEAEVNKQGSNNIVVAVPGLGQKRTADLVGTTAELRFRQVMTEADGSPTTAANPTATPTPTGKNGKKASPSSSPSSSASSSPSSHGRAVSKALTAKAAHAAPKPSPSASKSPKPSATTTPNPQDQQSALGDTSGIDKGLLAQFAKLDCAKNPKPSANSDNPNSQILACSQDKKVKFVLDKAKVLGKDVTKATAGIPQGALGEQWQVDLSFNGTGTKAFGDLTTQAYQQPANTPRRQIAIVLDGQVVSYPAINDGPITAGSATISGDFGQQEAEDLANILKYGALPLKFEKSSIESVSPTLGSDQLKGGLIAGAIGLGLVVLYSLLYYRGLGIVSIFSLALAGVLTYEAIVLLGVTMNFRLSLAGIAGVIVAVGITADSFIIFFERLRDEVREGASLRTAVERGWKRARRTVLVADAVSFLAALVLYIVSVGSVQGFAFTLGLTTLVDIVVVFFFTKPFVTALARTNFYGRGHPMSGLDPRRLGARTPLVRRVTRTSRNKPKEA